VYLRQVKAVDSHIREKKEKNASAFTLITGNSDLSFWKLTDNRTMVMYLSTFGPKFGPFFVNLAKGFEAAAEQKLDRLVIDLTNNGGGSICLGRALIAFLQDSLGYNSSSSQNWGPEDIPISRLSTTLIENAARLGVNNTVWSPAFYDDQKDIPIANTNTSSFLPGLPHLRGGKLRNYSHLVHINHCGDYGYKLKIRQDYKASEIIILTNGFCGSMCAYFSNHIVNYDKVKSVVVGGMIERPQMQYSSFPGGQVMDSPDIYSSLNSLGVNTQCCSTPSTDFIPRDLLTSAAFRYTVREVYPPIPAYSTSPVEFTFQGASEHLYYNSIAEATQPALVWYKAAAFFSS